jgi:hypothetical protein
LRQFHLLNSLVVNFFSKLYNYLNKLILDANYDVAAKKSDVTTFAGAFEGVMRQHYPSMVGHIAIRLVSCPSICSEGLGILSRYMHYIACGTKSQQNLSRLQSQSL